MFNHIFSINISRKFYCKFCNMYCWFTLIIHMIKTMFCYDAGGKQGETYRVKKLLLNVCRRLSDLNEIVVKTCCIFIYLL